MALAATALCGPVWAADVTLQGTGATFPAPLYQRWFTEFNKAHPEVQINYQALGSGAGVKQFQDGLVNFGASDAAMTDEEIAAVKDGVVLLPMTAGSIVLAYNLPGAPAELKLSREAYVGIFLGKITSWNDPKIASTNPGATLPDTKITPVTRSDGSGTTFVFTQHLSAISDAWKNGPGTGKSVNFPVGVGGKGNPGVTALIKQTPGAIGYVEYGYAKQTQMPMASLAEQERRVREGRCREPDGRARQRRAAGRSARVDPGSGRRDGVPDRHLHLASLLQEVRRREDRRRAQGGHPLRPERRTEVQRGAGLHPASRRRRHHGLEGGRTDLLMSRIAQIQSAADPGSMAATDRAGAADSISRPPSTAEVVADRVFRSGTRLAAWAAVALVFYVVWNIARQAFPAMHAYGAAFLVGYGLGREQGAVRHPAGDRRHAVHLVSRARHRQRIRASRSRSS